jgi:hypothetical protein
MAIIYLQRGTSHLTDQIFLPTSFRIKGIVSVDEHISYLKDPRKIRSRPATPVRRENNPSFT